VVAYEEVVKIKEEEQREANQWWIIKLYKSIKKEIAKEKERRKKEGVPDYTIKQWINKMCVYLTFIYTSLGLI
jgi:uncharacterized membrane-anchored protein